MKVRNALINSGLVFLLLFCMAFACKNGKDRPAPIDENQVLRSADLVGTWYYIAILHANGTENELRNRESYLNLKADDTFENRFGMLVGSGWQIGTYSIDGNRLTLNPENREPSTYVVTFGDDGKKTFGLSGKTLTLSGEDSSGYKLEK
jgi:hypothetical protein